MNTLTSLFKELCIIGYIRTWFPEQDQVMNHFVLILQTPGKGTEMRARKFNGSEKFNIFCLSCILNKDVFSELVWSLHVSFIVNLGIVQITGRVHYRTLGGL